MLTRFSLYGFLKNQRYFEPFFMLVLLDKGLSFSLIGVLIAIREFAVNVLEIPSGALADGLGRRGVLIAAHIAYVISFALFALAKPLGLLVVAMLLFAVGESFRTGTHKAMIFAWLRKEGRQDQKSRIYGYTRSWSKAGSAVSVLAAAAIVIVTRRYEYTFYLCVVPYLMGIVNLLTYPSYLDGERVERPSVRETLSHLKHALQAVRSRRPLRRLLAQSMGYDGVFHSVKDYIQPVLKSAAIPLAAVALVGVDLSNPQKVAILATPVYFLLYLLAAWASRNASRVSDWAGGEDPAVRGVWLLTVLVFAVLTVSGALAVPVVLMSAFVALHVLHNIWRPIQVSRYEEYGQSQQGATVLSLESQSRRVATMIAAPLLGLAVDAANWLPVGGRFWPVGVFGLIVGLALLPRRSGPLQEVEEIRDSQDRQHDSRRQLGGQEQRPGDQIGP